MQQFNIDQSSAHPPQPISVEAQQRSGLSWPAIPFKKLRGSLLMGLGYLLSPLCWWNDLVFTLPVAYAFGYVCSLFVPSGMGIATSTLYTLVILGLVQFKVLDISAFLPDPSLIEHSTALSNNVEHQVLN